jgi:ATP adenylyltransferase
MLELRDMKEKASVDGSSMLMALHPYWRFEYAKQTKEKKQSDPFSGLKNMNEKERLIVLKGKLSALVLNKFPYTAGHLLAIPYRAVRGVEDLTKAETAELMEMVVKATLLLKKVLKTDGVNIGLHQGKDGISGGSVPKHLHWHIVPRWQGDHNFLPIISGVRIMITSQENIWKALRKECSRI